LPLLKFQPSYVVVTHYRTLSISWIQKFRRISWAG